MSERRVRPGGERNRPLTAAEQAGIEAFAEVPELEIGGENGVQPIDDSADVAALEPDVGFVQEMKLNRRAVLAKMGLVPKEDRVPQPDFSDDEITKP